MQPMYYIGLDVHKRKISYCVKDNAVLPRKSRPAMTSAAVEAAPKPEPMGT